MERKVNYVTLKQATCEKCGPKLHEFGFCPEENRWYKKCIKCDVPVATEDPPQKPA